MRYSIQVHHMNEAGIQDESQSLNLFHKKREHNLLWDSIRIITQCKIEPCCKWAVAGEKIWTLLSRPIKPDPIYIVSWFEKCWYPYADVVLAEATPSAPFIETKAVPKPPWVSMNAIYIRYHSPRLILGVSVWVFVWTLSCKNIFERSLSRKNPSSSYLG